MELRADVNGDAIRNPEHDRVAAGSRGSSAAPRQSKKSLYWERIRTGFGAMAARKSLMSSPWLSANGGYCSLSDGSSFSKFRRNVVMKQDGWYPS